MMELFSSWDAATLIAFGVIYLVLAVAQIGHIFCLGARQDPRTPVESLVYEALVFAHVVVPGSLALNGVGIRLAFLVIPVDAFLHLNAVAAVLAAYLAWQRRNPVFLIEAALAACATPLLFPVVVGTGVPFLTIDAALFAIRVPVALVRDALHMKSHVTWLSIAESIKEMPDGILCATTRGDILLLNDRMRYYLEKLGLPMDLADARGIRDSLRERGTALTAGSRSRSDDTVNIEFPDGEVCLVSFDQAELGRRRCMRIMAYDVTENVRLSRNIAEANRELELRCDEIRDSMQAVVRISEDRAMVRMKSRVHDIIGQRLSMVHRLLEDGDLSDASIAQMRPLLKGILEDLDPNPNLTAHDELASIIDTFGLIGVTVERKGELPADAGVASAMVTIIREAATNAVRHAQALHVTASISTRKTDWEQGCAPCTVLTIDNDGTTCADGPAEGSGIPGMRRAAQAVGGVLEIRWTPRFRIEAVFPHVREYDSAKPAPCENKE